jgi:hypothetical protein
MLVDTVGSGTTSEEEPGRCGDGHSQLRSVEVWRMFRRPRELRRKRDEPRDFSANRLGSLGALSLERIESAERREGTNWGAFTSAL